MKAAIVIFAHGSSVESANESVRAVTADVARRGGFDLVETAFLEIAQPDLAQAVDRLAARGARTVLVIPYFLTLGIHLKRDLPRIAAEIERIHPGMKIRIAPPLDGHPAMSQALLDRAREAMGQ